MASGPPITIPGGHCHYMGGEVASLAAISAAVRDRVERRVDVVKVMASGGMSTVGTDVLRTQFTDDQLRLLVDQAHDAGLPVTAHAHGLPAVEQAVSVGVDGIEHCSCLTDAGVDVPEELVRGIAEAGIAVSCVIPPPPMMNLADAPQAVRELAARTGLTPHILRALRADMIGRLHDHGARVVTGIDAGLNPWLAHGRLHIGVALLSEAGLAHTEVLSAATSQAAQVCGLGDRKGQLRRGYDADLVIVDGDLSTDLGALQRVRTVVIDGELVRRGRSRLADRLSCSP